MLFFANLTTDRSQNKRLFAFTLLELIIALGIVAVLTGIITIATVPARQQSRDSRRVENAKTWRLLLSFIFRQIKPIPTVMVALRRYLSQAFWFQIIFHLLQAIHYMTQPAAAM